jgi:hypothetical protein
VATVRTLEDHALIEALLSEARGKLLDAAAEMAGRSFPRHHVGRVRALLDRIDALLFDLQSLEARDGVAAGDQKAAPEI